jgi:predicted nuclease with RNAse H fold
MTKAAKGSRKRATAKPKASKRPFVVVDEGPPPRPIDRPGMRTMGVDISAAKAHTAWAAIDWEPGRALVSEPIGGLDDPKLVRRLASADWVGLDGPFAWPREMVRALESYLEKGEWPPTGKEEFRYRRTDLFVHEKVFEETGRKLWPMSVSSDRTALTAWRLAGLRELAAEGSGVRFDRSGVDGVVEVHPPAALLLWGLDAGGYKKSGEAGRRAVEGEVRRELLEAIEERAPWLEWAPGARDACVDSADSLDAVLCALVARAAARKATFVPANGDGEFASDEGWIHLPTPESLAALAEE